MTLPIAIIAGEPNSISSEIIFKSWLLIKKNTHKPVFIIGNIRLLNLQKNKMKFNINIKKIDKNFKNKDLYGNKIPIYNTSRGGKLTWHGPGQRIIYFIINLKERGLDIRRFVNNIEQFIISSLSNLEIKAYKKKKYCGHLDSR